MKFLLTPRLDPISGYHPAPPMNQTRCEMVFQGKVQGVGFRATTQRIAQSLRLTGWVRNQSDGSVQLIAEGPEQDIRALQSTLNDTMSHFIHNMTDTFSTFVGEFHSFEIHR